MKWKVGVKKSDWNRMCVCSGCRNCCPGWQLMWQPSVNDLADATLVPLLADRPSDLDLCYNLSIDNIQPSSHPAIQPSSHPVIRIDTLLVRSFVLHCIETYFLVNLVPIPWADCNQNQTCFYLSFSFVICSTTIVMYVYLLRAKCNCQLNLG